MDFHKVSLLFLSLIPIITVKRVMPMPQLCFPISTGTNQD